MSEHPLITAFVPLAAYLLDLAVGDPLPVVHPVVIIGRVIKRLEALLRTAGERWGKLGGGASISGSGFFRRQEVFERAAGAVLAVSVAAGAYAVGAALVAGAQWFSTSLAVAVSVWLVGMCIAPRGLGRAATAVYRPLAEGDLAKARQNLSSIVGRETASLPPGEVVRGAVESVAENTVDAVVSPLFYAFLGGAPLALAYRAINTLDSMVGYRDDRYLHFGWASARLDDLANLLPARLTGLLMLVAASVLGLDVRRAWTVIRRDAAKHPSPNSGIPEAAMAGALGVRLGGYNSYRGRVSFRPYIGDAVRCLEPQDIVVAVRVMHLAAALAVVLGFFLRLGMGFGLAAGIERWSGGYRLCISPGWL